MIFFAWFMPIFWKMSSYSIFIFLLMVVGHSCSRCFCVSWVLVPWQSLHCISSWLPFMFFFVGSIWLLALRMVEHCRLPILFMNSGLVYMSLSLDRFLQCSTLLFEVASASMYWRNFFLFSFFSHSARIPSDC